jgi:hypothetical protein
MRDATVELPGNCEVLYNRRDGFFPPIIGEVMKTPARFRSLSLLAAGCIAALALSGAAFAQHGSAGHGGSGGYHGGSGGYHGGYGWHGGYGYHGGYGWHGYGWHGGYGWWGGYGWPVAYYGPWGWGGPGWWSGVPYYYAGNTYYQGLQSQAAEQPGAGPELIVYPKNGQSQEQMSTDKFECHRWAAAQTGFDPTQPAGPTASGRRSDYFRAQGACLEGRGYTAR